MNILIDGSSLLWRTHYANKSQNRNDIPNNIHLFLKSLKSYATIYNSRDIYIAWDKKLGTETNFRQSENDVDYKGNRDKGNAVEVYECQPKLHEITETLGCKNFYPWILEADDIISWLSKTLDGQNIIITTDGDMLQLINKRTCVYHPRKKVTIDHTNFESSTGMPIEHYLPYKAILGDTSDNIRGIKGYGPVGSKKLAKEWVENTENIKPEYVPIIERNIQLMDLSIGYNIVGDKEVKLYKRQLDKYKDISVNISKFESFCKKYDFKTIMKDIDKWKDTFESPHLLEFLNNLSF